MTNPIVFVPDGPPRVLKRGDWYDSSGNGSMMAKVFHDGGVPTQAYRRVELPNTWTPPEPPKPALPVLVPTGRKMAEGLMVMGGDMPDAQSVNGNEYFAVPVEELRKVPEFAAWATCYDGYRAALDKLGL